MEVESVFSGNFFGGKVGGGAEKHSCFIWEGGHWCKSISIVLNADNIA